MGSEDGSALGVSDKTTNGMNDGEEVGRICGEVSGWRMRRE